MDGLEEGEDRRGESDVPWPSGLAWQDEGQLRPLHRTGVNDDERHSKRVSSIKGSEARKLGHEASGALAARVMLHDQVKERLAQLGK